MFVPDRPIESDPRFQAIWGDPDLCPKCETELRDLRDAGHAFLVCPICDLGEPKNNKVNFILNWYGMDSWQSFDNGLIEETRQGMAELQDWWAENLHLEIREYRNGKYVRSDISDGNEAGQWFIYSRGYQIGCVTEAVNGAR